MFTIITGSSEQMDAVADFSVDLILSSPKYRAGCEFANWTDNEPWGQFLDSLRAILSECARVTREGGYLVLELADTSFDGKVYLGVAALYVSIARDLGFSLVERHMSLTHTHEGLEVPEHNWNSRFLSMLPNHSPTHQIVVLRKGDFLFDPEAGKILYYNYPFDEEGHPCPFSPTPVNFVLDYYFRPGNTVLDPCAGTARLGREVLRRGGDFIGYDLSPGYCTTARRLLQETLDELQ